MRQDRRIAPLAWTALFAAAALFPAIASANVLADQPYRITADDRVLTDVMVNGQGPFSFLLDTASSRSMIYEHVRARLGLAQSEPVPLTVYGIENVGSAIPVRPEQLQFSGDAIKGLAMGVLPDASQPSDGILGIDALSHYLVLLDRGDMRLKLLTPGSAASYQDWPSLALTPHPVKDTATNFWYLKANFNGRNITTLLDMGAGMTLINWKAAAELGVRKDAYLNLRPPEKLRDILGSFGPVVVLRDVTVDLNGRIFERERVLVADAKVFDYFNLGGQPAAILGPGLLKNNSLAIDFAGRRLYVGPAAPG